MACQKSRRHPATALSDEAIGRLDDSRRAFGPRKQGRDHLFDAGSLMALECAAVKLAFSVKADNTEGAMNDMSRLAIKECHDDTGHTHALASEAGNAVACRIDEHLLELGGLQTIQTVVPIEKKNAVRDAHQRAT